MNYEYCGPKKLKVRVRKITKDRGQFSSYSKKKQQNMLSIEREMCTNQRLTWCNDLVLKETYKFFNVDEERK